VAKSPTDSDPVKEFFRRVSDGVKRATDGAEFSKLLDQMNQFVGDSLSDFGGVGNGEGKSARSVTVESPSAAFDDVGGLEEAKQELEAICLGLRNPALYIRWGTRLPRGLLFFGPPGTGKTLLARCLAGQADAPLYHVRVVDVASMWYGQAEKRMQAVFDEARKRPRAIVFLDEIDALVPPRETAHEATHRVVSTLLENLDGLKERGNILTIAATNRPESVDPAFLRPGRIDRVIEVPLPDAAARRAIFLVHMRRAEQRAGRPLFAEFGWKRLLRATAGMSGAEIEEIVRRTLEGRVRRNAPVDEDQVDETEVLEEVRRFSWLRTRSPAAMYPAVLTPHRRRGWRLW
jgi:transitional endoplasmic reticulum ATPase